MTDLRPGLEERLVVLGDGLPKIPERLLRAHARGDVLFICGAGVSIPAGLPSFRKLVRDVYEVLDSSAYAVIKDVPRDACNRWEPEWSRLDSRQKAEVRRFIVGDYDVVLGMLERRLDDETHRESKVRQTVDDLLRKAENSPAAIHRALIRLADRGGTSPIVTTNFDRLLEVAARRCKRPMRSYSLGSIPRPSIRSHFDGVMHIHGALASGRNRLSELVLSDQDFGEFYLRRRVVPDFIYDASRLFNLVLVGYSANDPPMRYLLNAVAADGTRFHDVKERFAFFRRNPKDSVAVEDWKARGITPIPYDSEDDHGTLHEALEKWARLSPHTGSMRVVNAEIRRIVKKNRVDAAEHDRDLFDHLIRRSNVSERRRLSRLASDARADIGWLNAIMDIYKEAKESSK